MYCRFSRMKSYLSEHHPSPHQVVPLLTHRDHPSNNAVSLIVFSHHSHPTSILPLFVHRRRDIDISTSRIVFVLSLVSRFSH